MANVYADRVKETTTTTGTGTYDLGGAAAGHQTFVAGAGDTAVVYYVVEDGTDWEVGTGTVTDAATDNLSRDTIHASSNAGSAVNWGSGSKNVSLTFPATAVRDNNAVVQYRDSASPISATASAWTTYPLDTEVYDPDGIVSLSTNQITLPAGDYEIEAVASFLSTGTSQLRLQNITDAGTELSGQGTFSDASSLEGGDTARIHGFFTTTASKAFELQYYVTDAGRLDMGAQQAPHILGQVSIKKINR